MARGSRRVAWHVGIACCDDGGRGEPWNKETWGTPSHRAAISLRLRAGTLKVCRVAVLRGRVWAAAVGRGNYSLARMSRSRSPAAADSDRRRQQILAGPLRRTVFWLALPVMGEQTLNLAVAFFDTWLAGHLPRVGDGTSTAVLATGAVGFAAYVNYLMMMLALFVGAGTTALVSRCWGSGQRRAASIVTNRALVLALLFGLTFCASVLAGADGIVRLLGTDSSLAGATAEYLRKEAAAYPPLVLSLIAAAALRGSGDLTSPLVVLIATNATNMLASVALANGWGPLPQLGLDGIVAGTVLARYVQCGLLLWWLVQPRSNLQLLARHWRIGGTTTRRILRIGLPAAADGLVFWIAHFLFLRIINSVGPVEFAAHIVGIRIESLTYLLAGAWGTSASTMIGQNLGALQPERARRAGHEAVRQMTLVALATSVAFVFAPGAIAEGMTRDPAIAARVTEPLRLIGYFQVFLGASIVYVAALRGAGQTRLPLIVTLASSYLLRIPLAYVLALSVGWGLWGAWLAMAADMVVRGLASLAIYVVVRWERTVV